MPKASLFDGSARFDLIETGLRDCIRGFIETMLKEELTAALGRARSAPCRSLWAMGLVS
jgi:hypothetical protein